MAIPRRLEYLKITSVFPNKLFLCTYVNRLTIFAGWKLISLRYLDFDFVKLYMRQIETTENTTLVFVSFYIHFINLSKIIFLFTVSSAEIFSGTMILHCHFTFLKRINQQFAISFTIALTKINTMQKLFIYLWSIMNI